MLLPLRRSLLTAPNIFHVLVTPTPPLLSCLPLFRASPSSSLASRPVSTGWQRPIGCLKLQVISRKRATNHRVLLQKMTYKDQASYGSSPLCTPCTLWVIRWPFLALLPELLQTISKDWSSSERPSFSKIASLSWARINWSNLNVNTSSSTTASSIQNGCARKTASHSI